MHTALSHAVDPSAVPLGIAPAFTQSSGAILALTNAVGLCGLHEWSPWSCVGCC
ncbi:LOW QUALITY PROTEIN: hypothetical protein SPRG_08942 [Saprolegnia parasitica CBS 223.65]|uniref:Uncharacterized protein n=1 Tax=Saprolegnia parasitica (strain CBS 223.65) TaxID=695850 RepID=A0A067C554_SAPPC|nr:LOW QUALITY PROTEIN: hypothetical protein SPRG_08942 [Saprolegnia parasitica CBS 223.65]KDO25643.1 LOW QUALITY PROTEIN: hypothetical protein SPRG_08942 [Saprolegnia parasitica CBS 223.65]|eukprot:XP_012203674.1 LOW QUALITY PROTEIN: hypothetical protein SPRG_08942 [Saprolegnia parasitica CBS 223.65]